MNDAARVPLSAGAAPAETRPVKIAIRDLRLEYVSEERGTSHLAVDALSLDIYQNEFLCVVHCIRVHCTRCASGIGGRSEKNCGAVRSTFR